MRNNLIRATCLCLASVGSVQSASAQLGTGLSGSSTLQYYDRETGMSVLRSFGDCYAKAETAKALKLIVPAP